MALPRAGLSHSASRHRAGQAPSGGAAIPCRASSPWARHWQLPGATPPGRYGPRDPGPFPELCRLHGIHFPESCRFSQTHLPCAQAKTYSTVNKTQEETSSWPLVPADACTARTWDSDQLTRQHVSQAQKRSCHDMSESGGTGRLLAGELGKQTDHCQCSRSGGGGHRAESLQGRRQDGHLVTVRRRSPRAPGAPAGAGGQVLGPGGLRATQQPFPRRGLEWEQRGRLVGR